MSQLWSVDMAGLKLSRFAGKKYKQSSVISLLIAFQEHFRGKAALEVAVLFSFITVMGCSSLSVV